MPLLQTTVLRIRPNEVHRMSDIAAQVQHFLPLRLSPTSISLQQPEADLFSLHLGGEIVLMGCGWQYSMTVEYIFVKSRLFCVGFRLDLFVVTQVVLTIFNIVPELHASAFFKTYSTKLFF